MYNEYPTYSQIYTIHNIYTRAHAQYGYIYICIFTCYNVNFLAITYAKNDDGFSDTMWSSWYWHMLYQLDRWRSRTPELVWSYGVRKALAKIPQDNWKVYEVNVGYVTFPLMNACTFVETMICYNRRNKTTYFTLYFIEKIDLLSTKNIST